MKSKRKKKNMDNEEDVETFDHVSKYFEESYYNEY